MKNMIVKPAIITLVISSFSLLIGCGRGGKNVIESSLEIALHHLHSPQDAEVMMNGRSSGDIAEIAKTLAHWLLINDCSARFNILEHSNIVDANKSLAIQESQGYVTNPSCPH